jgi:Spirocyclase AveC-like
MALTSERLTATLERPRRGASGRKSAPESVAGIQPVVYWAGLGALLLGLMLYVGVRWVTGPYFKAVDTGPTPLGSAQHAALLAIQIAGPIAAVAMLYWLLVRPWLRERRITSEGLLVLAYQTLWFQDPVGNGANYWFLYNSHLYNRGSWVNYLPFWSSYGGKPGHMFPEPIFGIGPGYIYFFVIGVWAGMVFFNFSLRRFPQFGVFGACVVAYGGIFIFDVVLEAVIWMPTGFYTYPGAGWLRFGSSAHAYAPLEGICVGFLCLPFVLLRHYRDDRGYTWVERGVDKVRCGPTLKVGLRLLALIAVAQSIMFFAYNIWIYQIGAHASSYPKAVLQDSYFLNGLCGAGTNRACPGPAIPNTRGNSAYVTQRGTAGIPAGTKLQPPVRLK